MKGRGTPGSLRRIPSPRRRPTDARGARLRRWIVIQALAAMLIAFASGERLTAAEGADVVHLKDGRKKIGRIERQTDAAVFLEIEPGEVLPISRDRIDRIERVVAQPATPAVKPAPEEAMPPTQKAETQRIFEDLKDLGHSSRDLRKAAMKRALDEGFRAVPVLLAMFHPQQKATPELRIGALRALAQLGPLDKQAAETLGWIAMKAENREVHREACRTIRHLKEDRAINYILQFSISKDKATQIAAARALREVNDDRAFAALAGSVPQPSVNMNAPENATSVREIPNMPIGGMLRGPLFLPTREVQGTAENIMSPQAETLTMIAGKKLGGLPGVWLNWWREKVGVWTTSEREDAYRKHRGSLLNKMGSPQAQGQ